MNHCGGLLPDRSSSALSHFLTRNADPYMNGGVQGPFPTDELARTYRRVTGESTGGEETSKGSVPRGFAPGSDRMAWRYLKKVGVHRRKHGQPCRRDPQRRYRLI